MKKTLFLLAFILPVCSLVLGQTIPTPVVPSAADQNFLEIESVGLNNVAKVDQQGKDNWATVDQAGIGNRAIVNQINHNTKNATNPTNADNIISTVNQTGNNNKAFVTQEHDGTMGPLGVMTSDIDQVGNGNKATHIQGPGSKTGVMLAVAEQTGLNNTAHQEQHGYRNQEFVIQNGNNNVGRQFQGNNLMGSNAVILQPAHNNRASQTQLSGTAQNALILQEGNGNKATQNQEGWVNLALTHQPGHNNVASQEQAGPLNLAAIRQVTNGNVARQSQDNTGGHHYGHTYGYPTSNVAAILQEGGHGNKARQAQSSVSTAPPPMWEPNLGAIYQNGFNNTATQTQDGGNNLGLVIQVGNGNVAHASQSVRKTNDFIIGFMTAPLYCFVCFFIDILM